MWDAQKMMKNRGGYTWDIHMDIGTAIKNFYTHYTGHPEGCLEIILNFGDARERRGTYFMSCGNAQKSSIFGERCMIIF